MSDHPPCHEWDARICAWCTHGSSELIRSGFCRICGAELRADGTEGPSARELEAALDRLAEVLNKHVLDAICPDIPWCPWGEGQAVKCMDAGNHRSSLDCDCRACIREHALHPETARPPVLPEEDADE